jgi:adenosylcobinamide-phosphate guanylyltransferase
VFVTSGDLPLLDESIVEQIVDTVNSDKTWTSIVTTKSFQSSLGLNPECIILFNNESYVHTGISIVNASEIKNLESVKEDYLIINDKRVCLNVNTKTDFDLLSTF